MRLALLLLAALVAAMAVAHVAAEQMHHKEDLSHDLAFASFLETESTMDAAFDAALLAEVGAETHAELHAAGSEAIVPAIVISHPPRQDRHLGVVLAGGKYTGPKGPDMSQSAADGSSLAPFDPFNIEKWHAKKLAWRQARKQRKVDLVTQLEALKATAERTKRRLAQEAIEIAEEKARAAAEAEAAKKKNAQEVESELMEISADASAEMETETEAETESESASEMLAELAAEAAVDAEQESAQELEAQADAEEEAEDLASAEADIEAGFEVDVEAEFGADSEAETDSETDADAETEEDDDALLAELSADPVGTDRPSDYVTMGREDLMDEAFNNAAGRAVFARRQRGQEIVRFEKTTQSSGGNAVVNGVTKLPCGKEITDKGLFAAAVSENLGATVEAADPEAPVRVDENIAVIKALPVVPQNAAEKTVDEYGDAQHE